MNPSQPTPQQSTHSTTTPELTKSYVSGPSQPIPYVTPNLTPNQYFRLNPTEPVSSQPSYQMVVPHR